MKCILVVCIFLTICPSAAIAQNVVRQTQDAQNRTNPMVVCQNPRFNFNKKEIEACINVYQACMKPDLNQSERELCIVDAVKKGKMPARDQARSGNGASASKGGGIDFSLKPFQAYDLIEMCEQKQNRNRQLCSGVILPNKAKIISDINAANR